LTIFVLKSNRKIKEKRKKKKNEVKHNFSLFTIFKKKKKSRK
jgi:hypothetical protein